jgi:lysophospholipase L1-like esterase
MHWLIMLVLTFAAALSPAMSRALAQGLDGGTGMLDPFPENDRYRIQVWGDQMAAGLLDGLSETLAEDPRLALEKKVRWLGGLMRVDIDQEVKTIEAGLASARPEIVVVMLGAGDRLSTRRQGNRRVAVGSDEWRADYGQRVDAIMRTLRRRSVGVFWVGLPIMRRADVSADAEMMNEIFRSRALANGARFIDIFESFADADKSYDPNGPDLTGKIRLLRDGDGVHFTGAGYRKLAYFVERELKRAAAQAWEARTIPLAGSEAEQVRIRPPSTVKLAPLAAGGSRSASGKSAAVVRPAVTAPGDGGLAAETARVTIKSIGENGREESVGIELVRPAIPATVLNILTRRQSPDKAAHVGDTVMGEVLGDLTVVATVTTLGEISGERRRAGALDAGTPFSRVLVRGETLPPKPGRADEMPWPRPSASDLSAVIEEPTRAAVESEPRRGSRPR